jgi:hypothetical protein
MQSLLLVHQWFVLLSAADNDGSGALSGAHAGGLVCQAAAAKGSSGCGFRAQVNAAAS